ncbi:MAG: ferritin-like domain protein [Candidatus Xenolissoclinum pacificiensis L6]|uniref:Ferritin-like domain protein n=1 Tax=Candidatus Xenolissoclinum pacificiensis L6 TaxID=1401685 RepID=W2V020_9RICK|nr:MAG: ferritin-like domain protein [Candidatus Xenolissoclinum pacificiensis L6]
MNNKNKELINQMNNLIVDYHILYIKCHYYHWIIRGISFISLHQLFEDAYKQTLEMIDNVAERISMLDGEIHFTLQDIWNQKKIPDAQNFQDYNDIIADMVSTYGQIIALETSVMETVKKYNDEVSLDILIENQRINHKTFWIIKKHI